MCHDRHVPRKTRPVGGEFHHVWRLTQDKEEPEEGKGKKGSSGGKGFIWGKRFIWAKQDENREMPESPRERGKPPCSYSRHDPRATPCRIPVSFSDRSVAKPLLHVKQSGGIFPYHYMKSFFAYTTIEHFFRIIPKTFQGIWIIHLP